VSVSCCIILEHTLRKMMSCHRNTRAYFAWPISSKGTPLHRLLCFTNLFLYGYCFCWSYHGDVTMLARILRGQNFSVIILLHNWFCHKCLSDIALTGPDDCCDELKDIRPQEAEHLVVDDIGTKRCFHRVTVWSAKLIKHEI
jgi:hypothetical protein